MGFIYSHSEQLEIDPWHLILVGSSAGAIITLQADYLRTRNPSLLGPIDWEPYAVVAYSGAVMCRRSDFYYPRPPAPTMLVYGGKDKVVSPYRRPVPLGESMFGSVQIRSAIRDTGQTCWTFVFPEAEHEIAMALPETKNLFVSFISHARQVSHEKALEGGQLDATLSGWNIPAGEWRGQTILKLMKKPMVVYESTTGAVG